MPICSESAYRGENSVSEQESGKSKLGKLLLAGVLLAVAVAGLLLLRGWKNGPKGDGAAGGEIEQQLSLTRTGLAITENMEPKQAEQSWAALQQAFPEDASVALNRALNRVLLVDLLAGQATNALLSDAERAAAREQLPDAMTGARGAIGDYEQLSQDAITSLWLRSRVDLHEANLLEVLAKSLRRELFDRLTAALSGELGKLPQSVILGGPLIEVIDRLEYGNQGLPPELLSKAAAAVGALSNQHDDNLFLAIRAARLNIDAKNEAAAEYVTRSAKLAAAITPLLAATTKPIGLTPEELVGKVTTAIATGDWNEARTRMLQWFNILNPTEILKTDRRRASPHPLDRLSFDTLRRLSAAVIQAEPIGKSATEITFQSQPIPQSSEVSIIEPIDFDLDLVSDLAAVSGQHTVQLWRNSAGKWAPAGEVELDIQPAGLLVADLFMVDSSNPQRIKTEADTTDTAEQDFSTSGRHDTFPGLIAYGDEGIRLIVVDGRKSTPDQGRLTTIEKPSGLEEVKAVTKIVTGDLEGDGDLDLIVATATGLRLFINRGNRTFFEVTTQQVFGSAGDDSIIDLAIADIDRDLDLDVLTLHRDGQVGVLENMLHLQFRGRMLDEIPRTAGSTSIGVADIDGNVSWDLVISGDQQTVVVFSQTADAGIWTVERVVTEQVAMPHGIIADLDNDAWSELVSADANGGRFCRLGPWGIDPPVALEAVKLSLAPLRAADFNADGKLDLAAIDEGQIQISINETTATGHYLVVRFRGIADNAANSGRVNHFAIGSVLELRFGPHYRAQIVTSPATHLALGDDDTASSVRVIFPNGMTQTIRDPSVDTIVEEEQSLKGSCPYLYAWDGEKFAFVTDCLWAAPLGLQVARGVVAKDRPWEYLKLDGRHIQPRDGRYELRITEELWEVAYLDKVGLSAVDHPSDVQIWTNEKVGPAGIAQPTVFAFRDSELRSVAAAVDAKGRDVTGQLRDRDGDFVQGFDRRLRQGLCPPHWIDLDFGRQGITGDADQAAAVYLVLTGWILPTDTSLNIQIDQNPELPPIEFPSVWVPDADEAGGWRKAIPFMGFPGGKTKTIVVDVTDVIDRADPRLRIRTSAQIYWDDAQLALPTEPAALAQHDIELLTAEMAYHGYSRSIQSDSRTPETYDYQQTSELPKWPPLRGGLTQFGPCDHLLRSWDDQMVVMSGGDELRMTFSVPETPLPAGWQRDFVLHCVGWDKDADLNTLAGQSTGPLPFRGMGQYPPSAARLAEGGQVQQANRGHRQRQQSFRAFWYRSDAEQPSRFFTPVGGG
jgi:hypothetical protein